MGLARGCVATGEGELRAGKEVKTCYSLFSGAGGSDCGMAAAGYTPIGGIEYHQPAADIYNLNHPVSVTVADILSIDSIPTVDLLWLSPPCPSFSIVNANRGETDNDRALAHHLARLIKNSRPNSIAIENVRGYAHSQSLAIIISTLLELGYEIRQSIECAANYGTPTTRERLIVRASMTPMRDLIPTHQKPSNQLSLFALPDWARQVGRSGMPSRRILLKLSPDPSKTSDQTPVERCR